VALRRVTATVLTGLVLLGGYGTADVLDLVPGILTRQPELAAYPTPTAPTGVPARLPLPSAAPSGMPVTPVDVRAPLPSAAGLKAAVAPALADPDLKGAAVVVRDALTNVALLDLSGSEPRIPASNTKLIAALAVQQVFPRGSTLSTRVVQGATPDQLVLVAGGDMLLAPDKGDPNAVVGRAGLGDLADAVAASLRGKGVARVTVHVDASYAPGAQEAAGWKPAYRTLGVVGGVTMLGLSTQLAQPGTPGPADPIAETVAAFAARLTERGIAASAGGSSSGFGTGATLGEVRSAPVTELIGLALERSDNTITESLARQAAFRVGRPSDFEGAAAYLREALTLAGIDARGVSLHDASGLSRSNLVPATVLADVVELGVKGTIPGFTEALRHLPVAGLTGTLEPRFTAAPDTPADGVLRAKTGSLNGVNALAGTVVTADGRMLVFVILQEGPVGTTEARAALDRFGAALATCGCR
jgi:D-alanyl-D-alanine carboxypeptidase/D-alanyl-D-alanine-endopeptidase (penicillin-binding protein 4)